MDNNLMRDNDQGMELFVEGSEELAKELLASYKQLMAYYRSALMLVETKFNILNEEFSLQHDRNPISSIHGRLKSLASIREKLQRKDVPNILQGGVETISMHLDDVAGIRVVCTFVEDVYAMANALLAQDDVELIEMKDYIKNPKPSGYRSLHLIIAVPIYLSDERKMVRVEVQFRTIAMDTWASLEHQLRYKKEHLFDEKMTEELRLCADLCKEVDQRMDGLRQNLL